MCGVAGLWSTTSHHSPETLRKIAARMNDRLAHRGPDSGAIWAEAENGVALGHRRLAIIDRSAAGAQPMASPDGRYVITFNGEIFNFQTLADELRAAGHPVGGAGDTAALVAAFAAWGVAATLPRLNGQFALALWDRQTRTLTLARDQLGIKPLYWALIGNDFFFASELRAMLEHPACPRQIDRLALGHYFRAGNVPAPCSIFAGVQKLAPATCLTFQAGQEPTLARYWDLNHIALNTPPSQESFAEAAGTLHDILRRAVKRQMIADVPLGALLSGGIDSTLITALLQSQSQTPVKTFSIGFNHADFDEAPHARAIAAHLRTDHTEAYATSADAQSIIPHLPEIYDEPFADSSQIPTYLIARIARQKVTVALSGDGGDEAFLGYNRYRAWENLETYPPILWRALASLSGLMPPEKWNRLGRHLPQRFRIPQLGDKLVKLAALNTGEVMDAYRYLTSWWQEPERLLTDITPLPPVLPYPVPDDAIAAMQLWDTLGYLPDDVLTKVDRASMAVALEIRVPFLDPAVITYGWSLPRAYKLQRGVTKRILRAILDRYVPQPLLERPKSGFGVPLAAWLRGPLRNWAAELLDPASLAAAHLEAQPIRAAWEAHQAQRANHQHQLWTVLMYLAWRRHWNIND